MASAAVATVVASVVATVVASVATAVVLAPNFRVGETVFNNMAADAAARIGAFKLNLVSITQLRLYVYLFQIFTSGISKIER
mgnify:CR=1 FL=1